MESTFTTMKLSLIEVLYSELTNKEIKSTISYIINEIINRDEYFSKFKQKRKLISEIVFLIIDTFCLFKLNATLSEHIYNFMRVTTDTITPISLKPIRLILYFLIKIIIIYIKQSNILENKFLSYIDIVTRVSNYCVKFLYLVKGNFVYASLIDFLFGIMAVNKERSNDRKFVKISFFLLSIILKYGEQVYSNSKNDEDYIEIPPPKRKAKNEQKGKCAYCKSSFNSPCAMKCCGFVFCYNCAEAHCLNSKERLCYSCGHKVTKNYLIKIYS